MNDADATAAAEAAERAWEQWGTWQDVARAVVAVLPTAYVSNEAITEALAYPQVECVACRGTGEVKDENWSPEFRGDSRSFGRGLINCGLCGGDGWRYDNDESAQVARVRALLDAQAAAHAAEVEALRAEVARLRGEVAWHERMGPVNAMASMKLAVAEALNNPDLVDTGTQEYRTEMVKALNAIRDRAVAEALEHAAKEIEAARPSGVAYDDPSFYRQEGRIAENEDAAEIVRSLIPKGDNK